MIYRCRRSLNYQVRLLTAGAAPSDIRQLWYLINY